MAFCNTAACRDSYFSIAERATICIINPHTRAVSESVNKNLRKFVFILKTFCTFNFDSTLIPS
jgi:hypothetical protein